MTTQTTEQKAVKEDTTWPAYVAWVGDSDNTKIQNDVLTALQKVLETNPTDWNTLTRLAYVSFYKKDYSSAIKYADESLKTGPEDMQLFQIVLDFYDAISRDNPSSSSRYGLTGKKLELRKKIWGMQK